MTPEPTPPAPPTEPALQPVRVLIVDDDAGVLHAIRRVLRGEGYQFLTAADGRQAVAIMAEQDIAAIICDQRMPGMTGSDVLAEARRLRPDASRLTITAYTELPAVVAAINEGGVHHFLLKPWDEEHLRVTVRNAVGKHRMIREVRDLHELTRRQRDQLGAWTQSLEAKVVERTAALRTAYEETVDALMIALDTREHATAGHSRRVTAYALYLALGAGVDPDALEDLYRGAMLHDIGKIGIPDAILLKPGKLDPDERRQIEQHVLIGAQILDGISYLRSATDIPKYHHERFDGKGYCEGLAGEAIPLQARLFAIIDVYDALRSERPYKPPMPHADASAIIAKDAGTHFDPHLVEQFLAIEEQTWARLAAASLNANRFDDMLRAVCLIAAQYARREAA
ncbi:MAG: response regulator [Phycisphaerales bacterium]|nr:response regulator [Phycisphaerales bacterium]